MHRVSHLLGLPHGGLCTAGAKRRGHTERGASNEPQRADHGNHRTGRQLSRRTAAVQGLSGLRSDGIFLLPVNLYGPRDNFDLETSHVIPAMIRKMIAARDSGSTVTLWGDGTPTREFLFVEDCARASCWRRSATTAASP